jgi:hypothetical protein
MPFWPVNHGAVECGGIQIGVIGTGRQRVSRHLPGGGIDADDRVQSAIGDPGCAVRTDDDPMGRRTVAQRDLLDLASGRIEPSQGALSLRRIPDSAIGRRRHVMGPRTGRHLELLHGEVGEGLTHAREQHRGGSCDQHLSHRKLLVQFGCSTTNRSPPGSSNEQPGAVVG